MGHHTFDPEGAARLEDAASRYRYLSRDELLAALDPAPDDAIADLGSGTGFYTDDVAPAAGRVYALDVQPAMHAHYREKGVPPNVALVTAEAGALPFGEGTLDAAFSTMTFHEFAGDGALADVARSIRPGGRLVVADWTATGAGEAGPPLEERYDAETARELVTDAGLTVRAAVERPETFLLVAGR